MPKPARQDFDAVFATLGIDQTLASLPVDATIRAHLPRPEISAGPLPASATGELPRLTLEHANDGVLSTTRASDSPGSADILVRRILGEGGMGKVYLASQRSLGRDVAVKTVREDAPPPSVVTALLHEARVTGELEHPSIVPVHALALDAERRPLMIMKRVEGTSWRELLRNPEDPTWKLLPVRHDDPILTHVDVLIHVCNALQFAHARGVVHRDIKPDNVMIGHFGEVYLLDWGIAARMRGDSLGETTLGTLQLVGTPAYMAPEMVDSSLGTVDERTDVYLLGATLHEVITTHPRHAGETIPEVLLRAYDSEPYAYDASVPDELAALCNDATRRNRDERPPTVAAFRQRLADYLGHRASRALADSAAKSLEQLLAIPGVRENQAEALSSTDAWRFMTECRFGYMQSLREWTGNAPARQGLQAVLERMIEREIAQKNPAAARTLIDELPEPRPALSVRVQEVTREADALRAREEKLRVFQREMDPSVSNAPRVTAFVVMMVFALGVSAYFLYSSHVTGRPAQIEQMIVADIVTIGAFFAAGFALRRRLFANAISRRLSWAIAAQTLSLVLVDVLAYVRHGTPAEASAERMIVLAASFTMGAILSMPALGWLAASSGIAGILITLFPAYGEPLSIVSVLGIVGLSAALVRAGKLRPREGDVMG